MTTSRQIHRLSSPRRAVRRCAGLSLLEMAAATALVAGTLVPSLAVMREAMYVSREGVTRHLLANYAVQILENQSAIVMRSWTAGSASGNFGADGYAKIRFSVTRSDQVANGGLVDQLMHIQVTVFNDDDGDSVLDANELKVSYRTKVAKLFSYQNAEN